MTFATKIYLYAFFKLYKETVCVACVIFNERINKNEYRTTNKKLISEFDFTLDIIVQTDIHFDTPNTNRIYLLFLFEKNIF